MPEDIPKALDLKGLISADDLPQREALEVREMPLPPLIELGQTGLKRTSGYMDEEFLVQLKGRKAVQVYREMSNNEPLIGAMLFAIDQLVRNIDWTVKPAGKSREETKAAEFLESCLDDMSHTWSDFISDMLSMLPFGWSFHEIVYKRRVGPWEKDPKHRSRHTDNLIGWRKLPIRSQDSLFRWVFDDRGDVLAMVQMAPPRYQAVPIPIQRGLLFNYRRSKGNPEGVSLLRTAYQPWYYKKRIQEFESIGIERDLAGMPIVKVPVEYLQAKPGTDRRKMVESFKKMVRSVRRNEQEGLVFPVAYDQDTKQPLFNFELLGSGGGRAFSTDAIIRRYEERILMTVLADFIMVGHQQTGSYSLHTDKTGIFRTALNSIGASVAEVFNRHAIPRLFDINGWRPEKLPELVASEVDVPDLAQLAQFMGSMQAAGVTWFPDGEMEKFIRKIAKLPEMDEDSFEQRQQMARLSEASQFASQQSALLQAKQQVEQAMMPPQPMMPGQGGQPGQQGMPGGPPGQQGPGWGGQSGGAGYVR